MLKPEYKSENWSGKVGGGAKKNDQVRVRE